MCHRIYFNVEIHIFKLEYPAEKSRLTKINFNFQCDLICKLQIIDYICNRNNQFTKLK